MRQTMWAALTKRRAVLLEDGYRKERGGGYAWIRGEGVALETKHRGLYIQEHRAKAAKVLGRPLKRSEVVHHIDLDPRNNANSNLLICTPSYHSWLHYRMGECWAVEHLRKGV